MYADNQKQLEAEEQRKREQEGKVLKHEDELQDISNMNLSKFDKKQPLTEKSQEFANRGKQEKAGELKENVQQTSSNISGKSDQFKEQVRPEGGYQQSKEIRSEYQSSNIQQHGHIPVEKLQKGFHVVTDAIAQGVEGIKDILVPTQEGSQQKFGQAAGSKVGELKEKAEQKSGELKEKFENKQIEKSLKETNIKQETHVEAKPGSKTLTEQKKEEILALTQKLTEKVQKLKQAEGIQGQSQYQSQSQSYSSQASGQNIGLRSDSTQTEEGQKPSSESSASYPSGQSKETFYQQRQEKPAESQPGLGEKVQGAKQKIEQGAQDISSKLSEKAGEVKEGLKSEKEKLAENMPETQPQSQLQERNQGNIQKGEELHEGRKPIVDQFIGRIHEIQRGVERGVGHKVEELRDIFKIEETQQPERVPLVDQVSHSIHNVTDRISHGVENVTGVFKRKGSARVEKTSELHDIQPEPVRKISANLPQSHSLKQRMQEGIHNITHMFSHGVDTVKGKLTSAKKEKGAESEQEIIEEESFPKYRIGDEFRENLAGFTHTMDEAFQDERIGELSKAGIEENPFEPFGEKDIHISQQSQEKQRGEGLDEGSNQEILKFRIPGQKQEEEVGREYKDFKTQGFADLRKEGTGGEFASYGEKKIELKQGEEVGHEFQDFKTQGVANLHNEGAGQSTSYSQQKIEPSGYSQSQRLTDLRNQGLSSELDTQASEPKQGELDFGFKEYKTEDFADLHTEGPGQSASCGQKKTEPKQGEVGHEFKDFKTQGFADLHKEGTGQATSYGQQKIEPSGYSKSRNPVDLRNEGLSSELDVQKNQPIEETGSFGRGYPDYKAQSFEGVKKESSYEPAAFKGDRSLIERAREQIEYIDKLLERSIAQTGGPAKKSEFSSMPQETKAESYKTLSTQSTGLGLIGSDEGEFSKKVNEDLRQNDELLNRVIYEGENIEPKEQPKSSAQDIQRGSRGSGSQKFRDITNEVAGDFDVAKKHKLSQKVNKDLSELDRLLEKCVKEGEGFELEDKENVGQNRPAKSGSEKPTLFSQADYMRNFSQNI